MVTGLRDTISRCLKSRVHRPSLIVHQAARPLQLLTRTATAAHVTLPSTSPINLLRVRRRRNRTSWVVLQRAAAVRETGRDRRDRATAVCLGEPATAAPSSRSTGPSPRLPHTRHRRRLPLRRPRSLRTGLRAPAPTNCC